MKYMNIQNSNISIYKVLLNTVIVIHLVIVCGYFLLQQQS